MKSVHHGQYLNLGQKFHWFTGSCGKITQEHMDRIFYQHISKLTAYYIRENWQTLIPNKLQITSIIPRQSDEIQVHYTIVNANYMQYESSIWLIYWSHTLYIEYDILSMTHFNYKILANNFQLILKGNICNIPTIRNVAAMNDIYLVTIHKKSYLSYSKTIRVEIAC